MKSEIKIQLANDLFARIMTNETQDSDPRLFHERMNDERIKSIASKCWKAATIFENVIIGY